MKTRDLIIESYLLVTAFALFGIGMFGFFGYVARYQHGPLSLVMLPDSAMCAVLLGSLILSTFRQARSFILLTAVLLTTICLYTLIHNQWAGDSDTGQSWISASLRMRSELALLAIVATLGIGLSLLGRLGRYTAQAIGIFIILLGIILLLVDFFTELNAFRLSFNPYTKILMNAFTMALGISVFLLAQASIRPRQTCTTRWHITGFIAVIFTCAGWYLTSTQNLDNINRESNVLLAKTKVVIERTETDRMTSIQQMSERWQSLGDLPPVGLRQQEFDSYLRDFPELGLIAILDQDFIPVYQQSRNQQQLIWLSSFLADNDNLVWLKHVLKVDRVHSSEVHAGADEIVSTMIASRIILPGRAPLVLVASLDIRKTMWQLNDLGLDAFDLRLYQGAIEIFSSFTEQWHPSFNDVGAIDISRHKNKAWSLVSSIKRNHFITSSAYLPMLTLLLGLSLSGLLMLSRSLLEVNRKRAYAIHALNQTLQISEQRFRSLFAFNPDAVCFFDFDGKVQLANDAAKTLTGLREEPTINRHVSDFIFAEDLKRTQQHFADACTGFPQRYETRLIDSRGKLFYLDVSNLPIIVEGQVVGVFGIAKDITLRKETTLSLLHELTKAERRAAQLQGLSEAAIACGRCLSRADLIEYLLSQIGDVILVDQAMLIVRDDMSYLPKTNMWLSREFSAIYGDLSQAEDVDLLGLLTAIEKPFCLTQSDIETDPYWMAIASRLSKSGYPPLRGLILVPLLEINSSHLNVLLLSNKRQGDFDQDDLAIVVQFAQMAVSSLANIRLLEEILTNKNRLKSQLTFTSAITDSLSEGVIAADIAGQITFVNPAAEVLLGKEKQWLVGQPLSVALPLDPISWHSQNEQAVEGEFILTNGGNSTLLYNARPFRPEINSSGWVIALKDITAQRRGDIALHERNQVFDISLDILCMLNMEGDLIDVNPALIDTLHYPRDQIIGMPYKSLVHMEDRLLVGNAIAQLRLGHSIRELVVRVWDSQQALHWLQVSAVIGENKVIYCAAQDITLRRESDNQLRLFKRSVESSYNGVVISDALSEDMPIIYVNAAYERITGYSSNEVVGRNCRFLQGNDCDQPGLNIIREGLVKNIETHTVLRNFRKDGKPFWNDLSISPIHNEKGVVTHFVGIQNDISEERRVQEELSFNASHDLLTGLPNRRLLTDRVSQACDVSKRSGRYIAVMFIDLDGFKQINDSSGHFYGDKVLKEVASRLMEQVRAGDTVARIGGDEFVVLLPDLAQENDVLPVVERVLLTLAKPYHIDGSLFQTSASIGITLNDGSVERPIELIQQADIAMYKAKQEGRNNYQWFSNDLSQNILECVNLRRELQQAIENQDFDLYYQPQIDSNNGMVVGMEALIRWKHAVQGFISPIKFISVAEETGQIVPLSLWILDTACRHIRLLADQGMSKLSVAVNVSPVHFRRKDFLENIVTVLTRNKVNPEQLELEITESVLLKDTEQAIETFHKLKLLGIGIAIDDFGTGYSSLNYLKRLPLNKVKIDRSFITDIISNSDDAAITKGIISMAHHLRMKVIAEGVENEFQCAFLKKANCDVFQGYYFARPMPFAELQIFLRERMLTWVPDLLPIKDNEYQQTLLLLDDEENILRALTRVLRRDGYKVLMATRAQDAFELLAKHDVQVIISDQRMPEMNGTEFFRRVKAMYPKTIRIVLSGYTDLNSVTEAINEGAIYKFLTKPWDDDQLRHVVAEGFAASKTELL